MSYSSSNKSNKKRSRATSLQQPISQPRTRLQNRRFLQQQIVNNNNDDKNNDDNNNDNNNINNQSTQLSLNRSYRQQASTIPISDRLLTTAPIPAYISSYLTNQEQNALIQSAGRRSQNVLSMMNQMAPSNSIKINLPVLVETMLNMDKNNLARYFYNKLKPYRNANCIELIFWTYDLDEPIFKFTNIVTFIIRVTFYYLIKLKYVFFSGRIPDNVKLDKILPWHQLKILSVDSLYHTFNSIKTLAINLERLILKLSIVSITTLFDLSNHLRILQCNESSTWVGEWAKELLLNYESITGQSFTLSNLIYLEVINHIEMTGFRSMDPIFWNTLPNIQYLKLPRGSQRTDDDELDLDGDSYERALWELSNINLIIPSVKHLQIGLDMRYYRHFLFGQIDETMDYQNIGTHNPLLQIFPFLQTLTLNFNGSVKSDNCNDPWIDDRREYESDFKILGYIDSLEDAFNAAIALIHQILQLNKQVIVYINDPASNCLAPFLSTKFQDRLYFNQTSPAFQEYLDKHDDLSGAMYCGPRLES